MITEETETETKAETAHRPPDLEPASPRDPAAHSPRHRALWIIALLVAATILYLFLANRGGSKSDPTKGGAGAGAKGAAIPVLSGKVTRGDMPVYVTGLGSVNANYTVTVHSRVDGQLMKIHFAEGQKVKQGDLLAELDPRPFEVQLLQAQGQQAKDEAAYKNAQIDLQRYEVLIKQDAIPQQQLDAQVATVNQDEAALKTDQGQIESAKLNLVYCKIIAPIGGQVGLRLVDPGNIVHATDATGMLVITQLQPILVVFTIAADSLPPILQQLHAGRTLAVDAYDRDLRNRLASGKLLALDNQIDATTGTLKIKSIFGNEDNSLYPNQFVNARLLVDTIHGAVIVPTPAIQRSPTSTFVYVIKPDSTVEVRNIAVQLTEGEQTAVRGGLTPGETVVTDGMDKLQPGMKVAVSAPNGPSGAAAAQKSSANAARPAAGARRGNA